MSYLKNINPIQGRILTAFEMELRHTLRVLVTCDFNESETAEMLDISREVLDSRMADLSDLGIDFKKLAIAERRRAQAEIAKQVEPQATKGLSS